MNKKRAYQAAWTKRDREFMKQYHHRRMPGEAAPSEAMIVAHAERIAKEEEHMREKWGRDPFPDKP